MSSIAAANPFTSKPELRLIGGRHRLTGKMAFPLPAGPAYEPVELPPRGLLWSFTIQRFAPKSPPYRSSEPFTPFAVGYVELPGALIVESRLTDAPFESLHIGMAMELTLIEWRGERSGGTVQTYAFCPAHRAGAA